MVAAIGFVMAVASPLTAAVAQDATPLASDVPGVAASFTLPDIPLASLQNAALPDHPIADDRGIFLGGVGSDLWHDPHDPDDTFWLVTDRGPNAEVEVDNDDRRTFPVPGFTPLILQVRTSGESFDVIQAIPLVNQEGEPVTGLPNLADVDETPYDFAAEEELPFNPDGLDVEGIVRAPDGTFWLAEEYRPSLVKVDAQGTVLARYVPEGVRLPDAGYAVEATLPAIFAQRKENRGFEGLAISGDGQTLFALLQSPLSNPDEETGEASRAGRILAIDSATGKPAAEYVYPFEAADQFDPELEADDQDEMKLSGVVWRDETTLLVLERTDEVARLYEVSLDGASDILGSQWDDATTSPSLESLSDLTAAGVSPVAKALVLDLESLPDMPDKIEGVGVIDDRTFAVINDNDFDIGTFDEAGRHQGEGRESQLLVIQSGA